MTDEEIDRRVAVAAEPAKRAAAAMSPRDAQRFLSLLSVHLEDLLETLMEDDDDLIDQGAL